MKENYHKPDVEIFDDMGLALTAAEASRENPVKAFIVDTGRFGLDALRVAVAGIKEHPRGTAELVATTATVGFAAGGVVFGSRQSRN